MIRISLGGTALQTGGIRLPQKNIKIPKEEQLEAISAGVAEFYIMLAKYIGDLNKAGDLREYFTITKFELVKYLRENPDLMKRHLHKKGSPRYHEDLILECNGKKYLVYEMDHENPRDVKEYEDLAEATADFLMAYLPR